MRQAVRGFRVFGKFVPQCSASLFLSALTSVTSSHYTGRHLRPQWLLEMRSLFIIPFITLSRSFACALMSSWVKHYLVHWWANLTQPVMSLVAHMLVRVDRVRE